MHRQISIPQSTEILVDEGLNLITRTITGLTPSGARAIRFSVVSGGVLNIVFQNLKLISTGGP